MRVSNDVQVMGTSFVRGATAFLDRLRPGSRLNLRREPENAHDKNAVSVRWDQRHLGYLPRGLAVAIAVLLDAGKEVQVVKSRMPGCVVTLTYDKQEVSK